MEIAEFLLARFAEDEAAAREGTHRPGGAVGVACLPDGTREHVLNWGPRRALAECEKNRELLALADPYDFADDGGGGMSVHAEGIRRLLALPYADHPDYQSEWKV